MPDTTNSADIFTQRKEAIQRVASLFLDSLKKKEPNSPELQKAISDLEAITLEIQKMQQESLEIEKLKNKLFQKCNNFLAKQLFWTSR